MHKRPISRRRAPSGGDPIARRIRETRTGRGLTLVRLATEATSRLASRTVADGGARRARSVSASYVSLIENGHKVPNETVAVAIAQALDDDERLYRSWVRVRKHADLDAALAAAETLKSLLVRAATNARGSSTEAPPHRGAARSRPAAPHGDPISAHVESASHARLRVPVIPEGIDPGDALRPRCQVLDHLRLDLDRVPPQYRERLVRPFAWLLGEAGVRRVRDHFRAGDHAVVLRDFLPLAPEEVYAVRWNGRVTLSRVLWNCAHLLLLPAPGASDFAVLEAADDQALRALVLGVAFRLAPDRAVIP